MADTKTAAILVEGNVSERVTQELGPLVLQILNTRNDQDTIREALKVISTAIQPNGPMEITNCHFDMSSKPTPVTPSIKPKRKRS